MGLASAVRKNNGGKACRAFRGSVPCTQFLVFSWLSSDFGNFSETVACHTLGLLLPKDEVDTSFDPPESVLLKNFYLVFALVEVS